MAEAGPQETWRSKQTEQNTGPVVAAGAAAAAVERVAGLAAFLPGCSIASSTRPKRRHSGRPRVYLDQPGQAGCSRAAGRLAYYPATAGRSLRAVEPFPVAAGPAAFRMDPLTAGAVGVASSAGEAVHPVDLVDCRDFHPSEGLPLVDRPFLQDAPVVHESLGHEQEPNPPFRG